MSEDMNTAAATTSSGEAIPTHTTHTYRVVRGAIGRQDSTGQIKYYKTGVEGRDTIQLTDDQAKKYGDQLQLIPEGQYTETVAITTVPEGVTDPGGEVLTGPPVGGATDPETQDKMEAVKEANQGESGEEGETDETTSDTGSDTANDWNFLSTQNVPEAVETINSLETVEDVEAARKYEMQNSNRKGVLSAADKKLEQLRGE